MTLEQVLPRYARLVWALVAVALIAIVIYLVRDRGHGWIALAFAVMPDIGLLAGISPNLQKGQIHPRAVPLYNALHRLVGPAALLLIGATGAVGDWALVAAVAWAAHVAVDRALGYGLRDREGFVRGSPG